MSPPGTCRDRDYISGDMVVYGIRFQGRQTLKVPSCLSTLKANAVNNQGCDQTIYLKPAPFSPKTYHGPEVTIFVADNSKNET